MVDAFATAQDLADRLQRVFTPTEETWITTLLEDASTYLRDDVLGLQVFPQSQSTFTAWPDAGQVVLPQSPVISVDTVTADGVAVPFDRRDNSIWVGADGPVDVTFTFGYSVPPASLTRWACVLVSQALIPLEQELGLTAGGLSSVAIDDFKAAWANAGEESGITLSDRNIKLLRDQFGMKSAYVVGTR